MRRSAQWIGGAWLAVSVTLVVVTIVTVLCQVAFRYLLYFPLAWTEEVSRTALVGAVFAGLPAAYVRGEHVVVDFFVGLLPPWLFRPYVLVLKLICAATLGYLAYGAILQIDGTGGMTLISLPTFPVPIIYAFQAAALVSFVAVVLLTLDDPATYVSDEFALNGAAGGGEEAPGGALPGPDRKSVV